MTAGGTGQRPGSASGTPEAYDGVGRVGQGYRRAVEPLPESAAAADELDPVADDVLLLEPLCDAAERAREVVPDLVGVSLAALRQGITMTLVASQAEVAVLDAVQYVVGGPCVDAADDGRRTSYDADDPLDEDRWQAFARATAGFAVRSTLSLPLLEGDDVVVGSVNLYAGSARAFDDQHEALATIFGAWALGAVSNADLAFTTRADARQAPERLRRRARVETAVGLLAADTGSSLDEAARRVEEAAARAGVPVVELAEAIIATAYDPDPDRKDL